jgi:hypothetical protein
MISPRKKIISVGSSAMNVSHAFCSDTAMSSAALISMNTGTSLRPAAPPRSFTSSSAAW